MSLPLSVSGFLSFASLASLDDSSSSVMVISVCAPRTLGRLFMAR